MRFDVLTLFPQYFDGVLQTSLLGKACARGDIDLRLHQIRDYATDKHRLVDDTPYGGGHGMVMKAEPIVRALEDVARPGARKILMSARGRVFDQAWARDLAADLEDGWGSWREPMRDVGDRGDVGRDVLTDPSVAAGGRLDEHAVLVAQRHGQAVELQLAGPDHRWGVAAESSRRGRPR